MTSLEEIWPPYGVVISEGDLELRVARETDAPDLVTLVRSGIHPPDRMPFTAAWTWQPEADLPGEYLRFLARTTAATTKERWSLPFAVRVAGQLAGVQELGAENFPVTRSAGTGSWLGSAFQGRGIGTRMRRAVASFAFDTLGATELTSGAFTDNPASLAVSRKLGYRPNGRFRVARRTSASGGEAPAELQRLVLSPADLVRGAPIEVTGAEALLSFLGIDVRGPSQPGPAVDHPTTSGPASLL